MFNSKAHMLRMLRSIHGANIFENCVSFISDHIRCRLFVMQTCTNLFAQNLYWIIWLAVKKANISNGKNNVRRTHLNVLELFTYVRLNINIYANDIDITTLACISDE